MKKQPMQSVLVAFAIAASGGELVNSVLWLDGQEAAS